MTGIERRQVTLESILSTCNLFIDDFARTTREDKPTVEVVAVDGGCIVKWNGDYTTPLDLEPDDLLASQTVLVQYLRDFAMEATWAAWPLCPVHSASVLEPVAIENAIGWSCKQFNHVVSELGSLGTGSVNE